MAEPVDSLDAMPSVSVVVVTHNNHDLIARCLGAVLGSLPRGTGEVIVVDNASTDQTLDVIRLENPAVHVIGLSENVGFANAVNIGRARARGRYLALINSDAFPDKGCIGRLVDLLDRTPSVGIVGARLRYPSGRLQPSAGTFPSLLGALWVALFLHRVPGLSRLGIGYLADERLYRRPRPVDWVSAAVCAARIEVGPMPASSFMYGEDVEWARAVRERGLEVWLEPAATAVHISRASVDRSQAPGFPQRRRAEFELAWFTRSGGARARFAARLVLAIHALMRCIAYGLHAALTGQRDVHVAEYVTLLRAALTVHVN